jgi:hypothetical protein
MYKSLRPADVRWRPSVSNQSVTTNFLFGGVVCVSDSALVYILAAPTDR